MSRRSRNKRRNAERVQDFGFDVASFHEIFPDDPRYGSVLPGATQRTLEHLLRSGLLSDDCAICRELMNHRGPSVLALPEDIVLDEN